MSLGIKPIIEPRTGRFRFFVSYAREDYNIAIAVNNAIQTAAGPGAEVFMDIALQFGVNFHEEIKRRLDETNVLVVIHSGILKSAFAYPGLELGYFLRVMEGGATPNRPRLPRKTAGHHRWRRRHQHRHFSRHTQHDPRRVQSHA